MFNHGHPSYLLRRTSLSQRYANSITFDILLHQFSGMEAYVDELTLRRFASSRRVCASRGQKSCHMNFINPYGCDPQSPFLLELYAQHENNKNASP